MKFVMLIDQGTTPLPNSELTTEVIIAEAPKDAADQGAGHGHGGMDGMGGMGM